MQTSKRQNQHGRFSSPERLNDSPSSLMDFGKSLIRDTADGLGRFGSDMMDQITGHSPEQGPAPEQDPHRIEQQTDGKFRERITVFSLREQKEREEINKIKELLKQIKEELKAIKKADESLANEIKDAEKLTLEVDPKGGIYHVAFLEVILKLLHTARMKIGESGAWLHAMRGKPKRGSAFNTRKKKSGDQYSQSLEFSGSGRNTQ